MSDQVTEDYSKLLRFFPLTLVEPTRVLRNDPLHRVLDLPRPTREGPSPFRETRLLRVQVSAVSFWVDRVSECLRYSPTCPLTYPTVPLTPVYPFRVSPTPERPHRLRRTVYDRQSLPKVSSHRHFPPKLPSPFPTPSLLPSTGVVGR